MPDEIFSLNLSLLRRFDRLAADRMEADSLEKPLVEKDPGAIEAILPNLDDVVTLFIYGISPGGEEYTLLKPWLKENPGRTLVFLLDDWGCVCRILKTSLATEMLQNPQVILKLFDWTSIEDEDIFCHEFSCFFRTFSLHKVYFTAHFSAKADEISRLPILTRLFQHFFDEWLLYYHDYTVKQKEVLNSYYLNLLELLNAKFGQAMGETFKNVPAIICGAGPSLTKQLESLKQIGNRALIFGSGSGLNALSFHGICAHFAVGVDPTATQVDRLLTNFAFDIPFFYTNRFCNEALRIVHGERLFIRGGMQLGVVDWFEKELGLDVSERIPPTISTSNVCAEVAGILGCYPIILVGMDLSYQEGRRYAEGVAPEPPLKTNRVTVEGPDGQQIATSLDWLREAECFHRFSQLHPEICIYNATEGGMPIEGIPNITLREVLNTSLGSPEDLSSRIHEVIQRHGLDFISKERINKALKRWLILLNDAKQQLKTYLSTFNDTQGLPGQAVYVDMEQLLQGNEVYAALLKQMNELFDALNSKRFYRLQHYPEAYPTWMQLQMSQVLEEERGKFLIEALEFHMLKAGEALALLPDYPMRPASISLSTKSDLVEKLDDLKTGEQEVRYYYSTGELYGVKRFKKGNLEGTQELYYIDGSPRSIVNYCDGLLDGKVSLFAPGGELKRELHFSKGHASKPY